MKKLPAVSEMEHITSREFGEIMDAILERVSKENIIDFGDDLRFLELSKRLCRHIYYEYPQLVGSFVHMFRALFEEKEDEDGIGDD